MDPIKLTQQLVQIPSYVNNQTNEAKIGQFIFNYLKQYPWLKVQKQYVTGDRFNIIAQDTDKPRLLIVGHMDTVQPKSTNCFSGKIKNYKIYGLGSSDMKSSLAALLNSLSDFKQTKGLMLLFYIDEEYDFLGMKKFVKEYKEQIRPKLILGEGNDLKVKNGCRFD